MKYIIVFNNVTVAFELDILVLDFYACWSKIDVKSKNPPSIVQLPSSR